MINYAGDNTRLTFPLCAADLIRWHLRRIRTPDNITKTKSSRRPHSAQTLGVDCQLNAGAVRERYDRRDVLRDVSLVAIIEYVNGKSISSQRPM